MASDDSTTKNTNVYLVEDHLDFREALCEELESVPNFQVGAVFSNAEAMLEALEDGDKPDVIIMDLGLPGMDGLEAIPEAKRHSPDTKILVLTVFDNKTKVFQALGAGASGYLIKSSGLESIVQGILDACHGISPLSADIAQMVFNTFAKFKPASAENDLSEREAEVLSHLSNGMSRKHVAAELHVSIHTINTHIRTIYQKLQVHNVSGAVSKATSMGIL